MRFIHKLFLLSTFLHCAVTANECANATELVLNAEPVTMVSQSVDITNDLYDQCIIPGATWYTFVGNGMNLFLTVCAPDAWRFAKVSYLSGGSCGDSDDSLRCLRTSTIDKNLCGYFNFASIPEEVYYIAVTGNFKPDSRLDSTNTTIVVDVQSRKTPLNDNCQDATAIRLEDGQGELVVAGSLRNSTPDKPALNIDYGSSLGVPCRVIRNADNLASVWYKLTGVSDSIEVSACDHANNSFVNTAGNIPVNVHTGNECSDLRCIGQATCNWFQSDSIQMNPTPYVYWTASENETYYIEVYGEADFNLTIRRQDAADNDNCDGAVALADVKWKTTTISGFRDHATEELRLSTKDCGFLLYPGVWYSVQGTGNNLKLNPYYQNSLVSVFTGSCEALNCLGGNIPGSGLLERDVDFTWASTEGEIYYILAHGGYGDFSFEITDLEPPFNDQCEGAVSFDIGVMAPFSTVNASQNELELPKHCGISFAPKYRFDFNYIVAHDFGRSPGVWYTVKASNDPAFNALSATIDNLRHGSNFPELAVYSGDCGDLTCLGSAPMNYNIDRLVWPTNPGETYFVYVADLLTRDQYNLLVEPMTTVSNDRCNGAMPLVVNDTAAETVLISTHNATLDLSVPECQGELATAGVWYKLIATDDALLQFSREQGNRWLGVAVYSGDCQNLVCINSTRWTFRAEKDETYYILVSDTLGASTFDMRVKTVPAAPVVCFPGEAVVEIMGKGKVTIDNVAIGDMVKTGKSNFARVYAFGHKDVKSYVEYIQIQATSTISLKISPNHLMLVNGHFKPASTVAIGDTIAIGNFNNAVSTVKKISRIVRRGAYAPFTMTGTMLVNDVLVSNYVTLQPGKETLHVGGIQTAFSMHWLAHLFLAPHRLFAGTTGHLSETYNEHGLWVWVNGPLRTSQWVLKQHWFLQWVMFIQVLAFLLVMGIVETTVHQMMPLVPVIIVVLSLALIGRCTAIVKRSAKTD